MFSIQNYCSWGPLVAHHVAHSIKGSVFTTATRVPFLAVSLYYKAFKKKKESKYGFYFYNIRVLLLSNALSDIIPSGSLKPFWIIYLKVL